MKFKSSHKNYENYNHDSYYMNQFPQGFNSTIEGFVMRYIDNIDDLKRVCHIASKHIPCSDTQNWGYNFIKQDFSDFLFKLVKLKFYKMMDFISEFASEFLNDEGLEDLNDIIYENNIGYILEKDDLYKEYTWIIRDDVELDEESLLETLDELDEQFEQTIEHLEQSLSQLKESDNERARKDAVRDCMSAMESLLKSLSKEKDIKDASNTLFESKIWGPRAIVKDGQAMWSQLHQIYPDIRHGQPESSNLTQEEALYWIDRIMAFVKYMSRRYDCLKK